MIKLRPKEATEVSGKMAELVSIFLQCSTSTIQVLHSARQPDPSPNTHPNSPILETFQRLPGSCRERAKPKADCWHSHDCMSQYSSSLPLILLCSSHSMIPVLEHSRCALQQVHVWVFAWPPPSYPPRLQRFLLMEISPGRLFEFAAFPHLQNFPTPFWIYFSPQYLPRSNIVHNLLLFY